MAVPRIVPQPTEATEKNNQITYEEILKAQIEKPRPIYTPSSSSSAAYSETQNKMQQELDKINEEMLAHLDEVQEEKSAEVKQAITDSIDFSFKSITGNENPRHAKHRIDFNYNYNVNEKDERMTRIMSTEDMRLYLKLRFPGNTAEIDNMTDSELEEKYLEIQNIISNSLETGFNPFN